MEVVTTLASRSVINVINACNRDVTSANVLTAAWRCVNQQG